MISHSPGGSAVVMLNKFPFALLHVHALSNRDTLTGSGQENVWGIT